MVESLSGRDIQGAKDLSFDVLEQLGHGIMRDGRKLTVYTKLNLVKSHDKNLDPTIASTLPVIKDENARAAMKVLSAMIPMTYATNKNELCSVTSKMVTLVNKYGVCIEAANAYGIRGAFATNLEVIEAHAIFAQTILDQSIDRYAKAATTLYIYCLFSFTRKIRTVQKGLFDNYHYSLQVGDIQVAIYSYMMGLYYEIVCGRSLVAATEETRETMAHIKAMGNRGSQMELLSILFQCMLNMQGQSEDPQRLRSCRQRRQVHLPEGPSEDEAAEAQMNSDDDEEDLTEALRREEQEEREAQQALRRREQEGSNGEAGRRLHEQTAARAD